MCYITLYNIFGFTTTSIHDVLNKKNVSITHLNTVTTEFDDPEKFDIDPTLSHDEKPLSKPIHL